MLLDGKNAVVYGAGGALGGAVARAFAHGGARVFLVASDRARPMTVATVNVSAGALID